MIRRAQTTSTVMKIAGFTTGDGKRADRFQISSPRCQLQREAIRARQQTGIYGCLMNSPSALIFTSSLIIPAVNFGPTPKSERFNVPVSWNPAVMFF